MKNGYDNYLPKPEETELVQARIPKRIKRAAVAIAKRNKWTMNDVVEGLLNKFVDENKG